jgi:hypothetical protein
MEFDKSELDDYLNQLSRVKVYDIWKKIIPGGMQNLMEDTRLYPPALPKPTRGAWYDRGFGTRYIKVDGKAGATQATSEDLMNKWSVKNKRLYSEIKNIASYAKYVVGAAQTQFHKDHGWKNLFKEAEKQIPKILQKFADTLAKKMV